MLILKLLIEFHNSGKSDGSFKTVYDLGEIEGRFYGPNHEEVGGTLSYERYDGDHLEGVVYGAFGASRKD